MRLLLAHALVILVSIPILGAASRLNNSESKKATNSVKHESQIHHTQVRATMRTRTPAKRHSAHRPYQVGRASWYGKHFHGRKTASGERYDMFQFTAAHKRLPLGTYVKVTNLRNDRWVIVRVNDRGPVPQSRIIDLSYGAAQILGMRADGVERVRLDIVEPETLADNQHANDEASTIASMR
jgi:rare lipoprotein A (peptidoglycan hydrolase)